MTNDVDYGGNYDKIRILDFNFVGWCFKSIHY